jgi:hypothetical protein
MLQAIVAETVPVRFFALIALNYQRRINGWAVRMARSNRKISGEDKDKFMTDRHRLLELALKGLETEQTRIEDEMKAIRSELGGGTSSATDPTMRTLSGPRRGRRQAPSKGRRMTLAQRRKISAAMKRRWAARRAA